MFKKDDKKALRIKKRRRVRRNISGTPERPRLAVYRSNKHIYAQLIDDVAGVTLVAASSKELSNAGKLEKSSTIEAAAAVGKLVAEKAVAKQLKSVVFDRGGFLYHGRVKALADGAREGGLEF
ncbi:50S ribosomal protein L18 [Clostridia bacterium]|nr:50S ribosomal protein L18 [Clostridia bacterium]